MKGIPPRDWPARTPRVIDATRALTRALAAHAVLLALLAVAWLLRTA